jgi:zinc D-Ala-D-Ala dipeptidase
MPVIVRSCVLLLASIAFVGCSSTPVKPVRTSPLVDVRQFAPDLILDMRYAGADNFTGKPVPGYNAAKCLLHVPVAKALAEVERELRGRGYALVVYDCYRPTLAVTEFMRWAKAPDNPIHKARYYPDLAKSSLVPDYIAEKSGHSKGATLDVGLLDCRQVTCRRMDMGTEFDFFGLQAHTAWSGANAEQAAARQLLVNAMAVQGFSNYPLEWWHFTWKAGPLPDVAYDFSID